MAHLIAMVLVDQNWGIGCDGSQNIFLKEDLARFKATTQGHTILYGRKTLLTFSKQQPLPSRVNYILSRQEGLQIPNATLFHDIPSLLQALPPEETAFVIGGGSVYQALLPYVHQAYVTKVETSLPADTHFPPLDDLPHWQVSHQSSPLQEGDIHYRYVTYDNHSPLPFPHLSEKE